MKAPKGYVGLYLSSDRLEAVLPAGSDGAVHETYTYPLPPGIISDEGTVDDVDQLSQVLKDAWRSFGLRRKNVTLILNSRQAIVRLVRLPHLPVNQLHQAILSEAEQFALFRNDAPLVDYFVASEEGDFIWVCYGAASETLYKPYETAIRAAGLKLAGLDLVQLTSQRGMAYYHPPENNQWIGIMLLPQRLIVTSWHEGRLTAVRELVLPERDNISMELVALNYLPDAVRSVAGTNSHEEPRLVIGAEHVEDARELASHAEAHINLPICIAEPDEVDPTAELPSCVALGAAVWGRSDTFPSFNLIKGQKASGIEVGGLPFTVSLDGVTEFLQESAIPIVAGAAVLLGTIAGLSYLSGTSQQELSKAQASLSHDQGETSSLQEKVSKKPPESEVLHQWVPRQQETLFAAQFISDLRGMIPSDAWISQISYVAGNEVRLRGAALNQTSCMYFADQLGTLEAVGQVRIMKLEKLGSTFAFEITASLAQHQETEGLQ